LIEQSASQIGNAVAGGAAIAEDASTIFYNPAGMARLPGKQLVAGLHVISPSTKFSDGGSGAPPGRPLGGTGGDAGAVGYVPNVYFALKLSPALSAGVAVNAPFGLKTEYDASWVGRFQAIKSDLRTYAINPALAYRFNDHWSVGAGAVYQSIKAELTNAVFFGAAGEGSAKVTGDDRAWGFNLGALYECGPDTRFGLGYHSKISYKLSGDVRFTRPAPVPAALAPDGPVTADTQTPASVSLSAFHKLNSTWDVMADISWTQWNTFDKLVVVRSSGAVLNQTPENWKNSYRFSVGASYHPSDAWTWRGGLAYDQSPVSDAFRTARIPDSDRTWVALGGRYQISSASAIDFAYAHLFLKDASISQNLGVTGGNLVGSYKNSVDILSVQYAYSF
jgi:long-chain fatty acid transport protein